MKDIFTYILKPKASFYRKNNRIDELYDIDEYKINHYAVRIEIKKYLLNDSIMNYKNEILMAKIQYTNALNYYENIKNIDKDTDEYGSKEFLCKIYLEDTIIKLYSAYDKSYHILNELLELNIDYKKAKSNYKKEIREKIREIDKNLYKKVNSVFSKLQNSEYLDFRDNSIHNKSASFPRVERDFSDKNLNLHIKPEKSIREIVKDIEDIIEIMIENLNIIKEKM